VAFSQQDGLVALMFDAHLAGGIVGTLAGSHSSAQQRLAVQLASNLLAQLKLPGAATFILEQIHLLEPISQSSTVLVCTGLKDCCSLGAAVDCFCGMAVKMASCAWVQ
jgi:hypothetical protein